MKPISNGEPEWLNEWGRWDLTTHTSLSPIRHGFKPGFVHYKTGCTRLAAACDKVYQLLAHGRWFSPGTLALKHQKSINQSIVMLLSVCHSFCQSFCNIFVNSLEVTSFIPFWLGSHFVHTSGSLLISKFKCQRSRSDLNFNHFLVFILVKTLVYILQWILTKLSQHLFHAKPWSLFWRSKVKVTVGLQF